MVKFFSYLVITSACLNMQGCRTTSSSSSDQKSLNEVADAKRNADGSVEVKCDYGQTENGQPKYVTETVSSEDWANGKVCRQQSTSSSKPPVEVEWLDAQNKQGQDFAKNLRYFLMDHGADAECFDEPFNGRLSKDGGKYLAFDDIYCGDISIPNRDPDIIEVKRSVDFYAKTVNVIGDHSGYLNSIQYYCGNKNTNSVINEVCYGKHNGQTTILGRMSSGYGGYCNIELMTSFSSRDISIKNGPINCNR
jgi:hypothetical protein